MAWGIRPARADDEETVADDLALVICEIRRRLANTQYVWVVNQVCEEFDIRIDGAA